MKKITHAKGLVGKMSRLEKIERNVVAGYQKIIYSVPGMYESSHKELKQRSASTHRSQKQGLFLKDTPEGYAG